MGDLTLEQRVTALEQEMAALKRNGGAQPPANGKWWEQIAPQFKNDPVFEEMLAYGRYFRKTGHDAPPD